MAINVAGTYAIGDYLASEIINARTLMGDVPQANSLPIVTAPTRSGPTDGSSSAATDYKAQALAQNISNTQILFGIHNAGAGNAGTLAPLPNETPQQIAFVAIQSSTIASEFSNISTLFGSLGIGTNTNTNA